MRGYFKLMNICCKKSTLVLTKDNQYFFSCYKSFNLILPGKNFNITSSCAKANLCQIQLYILRQYKVHLNSLLKIIQSCVAVASSMF